MELVIGKSLDTYFLHPKITEKSFKFLFNAAKVKKRYLIFNGKLQFNRKLFMKWLQSI